MEPKLQERFKASVLTRDPNKPISYGSPVEQGTVLARLEDALFKARVDQSRAGLARAEADVEQAEAKLRQTDRELDRVRKLQSRGAAAAQEYDMSLANHEAAQAGLAVSKSGVAVARADLEEATVNLSYTTIRSPVKGVILDRRVNIGQTVIASLNAPSLFLIAKDLSQMEIWASVNETDIGSIHQGQSVRFTVGAFPGESFLGVVKQIRLNASMISNVVTYTVVEFENSSGKLLPYLTALLEFEVAQRTGVLLVPNAALRRQPRVQHVAPDAREEYSRSLNRRRHETNSGSSGPSRGSERRIEGTLWVVQGEFVRPIKVEIGLSDGLMTEVSGEGLHDGSEIVEGVEQTDEGDDLASFLPHTQRGKDKSKDKDKK